MLVQQGMRGSLRDDPAVVHDHDLIAQQLRLLHVMGGQDDGLALRLDGLHQFPEAPTGLRVESGGGLIQEQDGRIIDQRHPQQQALQLAAGELLVVALEQFLQRAQADDFLHAQAVVIQAAKQFQRLAYRQEVLQGGLLEQDAGLGTETFAQRGAPIAHAARRGRQDSLHDLDGGGLAGAIGSEQAEAAAFAHAEGQSVDGDRAAVMHHQVVHLEQ